MADGAHTPEQAAEHGSSHIETQDGPLSEEIIGGGQHVVSDVVFVVFGMLLIGIITRSLFYRIPVPYTVLLLIWGLIAGGLAWAATENHSGWHAVNVGLETLSEIDPNGMLLIFMPILIYGSAQAMDWHTVKKEGGQIMLMATTGVILSMCFTAVFIFYVFPFGWSWHECFMFGALISATDPVAVVALLHEVGASVRLGTIIEGESLLNDGTAFVLFLIFKEYVLFNTCCDEPNIIPTNHTNFGCMQYTDTRVCEPFTPADATVLFLKLTFGGPASGIMFGLLMVLWLTYTFNDEIVEIFISITGAYITFYISEDVFGVSGVLSIVTLGFFVAAYGRSKVSPRVMHPMETAWELLEWGANTVIFILSGVIMAENLAPILSQESSGKDLEIGGWIGWGIVLYILCVAVRFLTILIHFPLLKNIGYGMTWQQAVIISWSGLRGAIGLALALLVNLDSALRQEFRQQVLVFTSVVVVFTLLINGSLTKKLLEALGILRPEPIKLELLMHTIEEMEDFADTHCSHLKTDTLIGQPDWEKVVALSNIDATQLIDSIWLKQMEKESTKAEEGAEDGPEELAEAAAKDVNVDVELAESSKQKKTAGASSAGQRIAQMNARNALQAELLKEVRARLLHGLKASYNEGFHKGYIGSDESLELVSSVDKALDNLEFAMRDWESVEVHAHVSKPIATMQSQNMCHIGPLSGLPQRLLFNELEHGLVLAAAFVYAHKHTRQRLKETMAASENDNIDPETFVMTKQTVSIVLSESKASSDKAAKFIKALRYAYPEVTRAVKTKLCALTVLRKKGQFLDQLVQGGLLEHKDYEAIQKAIIRKINLLSIHGGGKGGQLPEAKEFLRSSTLFRILADEDFEADVLPIAKHVLFQPKDTLFNKGDNPTSLYIIIRGTTMSTDIDLDLGEMDHQGSAVGVSELLLGWPRSRSVRAVSIVEGFEIKSERFAELIVRHPAVEKVAWKHCGATLAFMRREKFVEHMSTEDVLEWFLSAQVFIHQAGEDVHIIGHNYLVEGNLCSVLGSRAINKTTTRTEAPGMLGPSFQHLQVTSDFAVLLQLPERYTPAAPDSAAGSMQRGSLSFKPSEGNTLQKLLSHSSLTMTRNSAGSLDRAPLSRMSAAYVTKAGSATRNTLNTSSYDPQHFPRSPVGLQRPSGELEQRHSAEMMRRLSLGPQRMLSGGTGLLCEETIKEQDSGHGSPPEAPP